MTAPQLTVHVMVHQAVLQVSTPLNEYTSTSIPGFQVHTLLKGLEKIAASADIPMLVAGDFNSVPGSAAHSLLVNRIVENNHPVRLCDPCRLLRPIVQPTSLQRARCTITCNLGWPVKMHVI